MRQEEQRVKKQKERKPDGPRKEMEPVENLKCEGILSEEDVTRFWTGERRLEL